MLNKGMNGTCVSRRSNQAQMTMPKASSEKRPRNESARLNERKTKHEMRSRNAPVTSGCHHNVGSREVRDQNPRVIFSNRSEIGKSQSTARAREVLVRKTRVLLSGRLSRKATVPSCHSRMS